MSNELNGGNFLEIQREYVGKGEHEMDDKKNEGQDFSRNNSICHIIPFGNSELLIHYRGTVTRVPAHGFLSMSYDDMTGEVVIEYSLNDEVYYACIHVDGETDAEVLANTLVRTLSSINVKSLPPPSQSRFVEKEVKMMFAKTASEFGRRDQHVSKDASTAGIIGASQNKSRRFDELQKDLATHLERRVDDEFLAKENKGADCPPKNLNCNEDVIYENDEEMMESQEELTEKKRSRSARNVLLVTSAATLVVCSVIAVGAALWLKGESVDSSPSVPVPMGHSQQQNDNVKPHSLLGATEKQDNDEEWQPR